ncbi:tetraspanin-6-like [Chrysoperla carnea]|uniref:tetraspanin-6-like n=1 Tax=Chrysoperla carnea TaxID=189513 RepID=UPI001D0879FC|nr:tetraspanin-6-like [Chrysoperla carnea]
MGKNALNSDKGPVPFSDLYSLCVDASQSTKVGQPLDSNKRTNQGPFVNIAIIIVCGFTRITLDDYTEFLKVYLGIPLHVIFLNAIIGIVITFFGIIGNIYNSILLSIIHFALLCILIISEIALVFNYKHLYWKESTTPEISSSIMHHIESYVSSNYSKYQVDQLQTSLQCCGCTDVTDFNIVIDYIPKSCCPKATTHPDRCDPLIDFSYIFVDGCLNVLSDVGDYEKWVIIYLLLGLAVTQILFILASWTLIMKLPTKHSNSNHKKPHTKAIK